MENTTSSRFTLLALVFCSAIYMTGGKIPSGFIMDVNVACGASAEAIPRIEVTSDLDLDVQAYCENGQKPITSTDGVKYILHGSFTPITTSDCQFARRESSSIYTVDISVAYGLIGSTIQQNPQFYTLTCTYDKNGLEETEAVTVTRGYIAPVELRVDAGTQTTSTITLDVYNVRDSPITNAIIRGCKVYISASTDGTNGEVGLRPTACDAINPTTNDRLPVLRAGCGTGLIFDTDAGFTTKGLNSSSPYFEAIQFEDDAKIQFECVFTLCTADCNGNSCTVATKKKRSAVATFLGVIGRSKATPVQPLVL